jgi:hypothetical protein
MLKQAQGRETRSYQIETFFMWHFCALFYFVFAAIFQDVWQTKVKVCSQHKKSKRNSDYPATGVHTAEIWPPKLRSFI